MKIHCTILAQLLNNSWASLEQSWDARQTLFKHSSTFGEQCFNEAIARGEDEAKKAPFGKYILPYAHFKLATLYTNDKNYDQAKVHLHKSRDNYKDYELDDRIQTQIRSLQRRIKHYTEGPKLVEILKARNEAEQELKKQKQAEQNNFYMS